MLAESKKKVIVEAIQLGLTNSLQYRNSREISYDNNPWNENLNFVYDSVMNLDGKENLVCFKFNRSGFYLVAIFDKDSKTLLCICSDKKFISLLKRNHISIIHYTDAFCQLSHDTDKNVQTSMFSEIEDKIDSIKTLLKKITQNFNLISEVKRFAIIETRINHKTSQLLNVRAIYLSKKYNVTSIDEEWRKYIPVDYDAFNNFSIANASNDNNLSENYLSSLTLKENKSVNTKEK